MNALGRTYLLVALFFAAVILVCMSVLLRQAAHDVQREMDAAQQVVDYLALSLRGHPQALASGLQDSLRHIRVERIAAGAEPVATAEGQHRRWLSQWLYPQVMPAKTVQFEDGQQIRLTVNPDDEVEEVWDSLLQLLALFGLALALSLLTIRWAVGHALGVLEDLLGGLLRISRGQLATRLVARRLPEAQRLAGQFNQMAGALEAAEADNLRLNRTLMELQERERTRLAQVMHDDLGQYVAGIRARACLLRVQADRPEAVRETAAHLEQHSLDLQNGFRGLVRDLYPVMLEHLSLEQAIAQLAEQWQASQGIACRFRLRGTMPPLDMDDKLHLYRLAQEALTNVARHAQASQVSLQLRGGTRGLSLLVADNGHGQPPEGTGVGLRSMRERARCLGARLRLRHCPGRGWTLYLNLPCTGATT